MGAEGRLPTHTDCLTISEWILATPLTAWDPMTQVSHVDPLAVPSSITDILRKRVHIPGNRAATCCKDRAVSGRAELLPQASWSPGWLAPEHRAA